MIQVIVSTTTSAKMSSNSMGRLPTELQVDILKQLSTIQDLYSFIRASPQHYQIFLNYKEDILFTVIGQMLGPEVLVDALTAVEASVPAFRDADRETVLTLLKRYKTARDVGLPRKKIPFFTSISLCQLHHVVEYNIKDYARRATATLKKCSELMNFVGSSHHSKASPALEWEEAPLSIVEQGRLRRALYRFEIFGRLFNGPERRTIKNCFSALEQAELFIAQFPLWQIEEIACIRNYFRHRITEVYEQVDDAFIHEVLARHPLPSVKKGKRQEETVVVEEKLIPRNPVSNEKKRRLAMDDPDEGKEIIARDCVSRENKRKRGTEEQAPKGEVTTGDPTSRKNKRKRDTEQQAWEEEAFTPSNKKSRLVGEKPAWEEGAIVPSRRKRERETEEPTNSEDVTADNDVPDGKKRKLKEEEAADGKDDEVWEEQSDGEDMNCVGGYQYCCPKCETDRFGGVDRMFSQEEHYDRGSAHDNTIMLGLPYLRHLLVAPFEEQTEILAVKARCVPEFLHEALQKGRSMRRDLTSTLVTAAIAPMPGSKSKQHEEYLGDQNEAWQWAFGDEERSYRCGDKGLRAFGYVFWDNVRLRASGVLCQA